MIKIEIIYDASINPPLQLNMPRINPVLVAHLLSQCITAATMSEIPSASDQLIIPATAIPKVIKVQ